MGSLSSDLRFHTWQYGKPSLHRDPTSASGHDGWASHAHARPLSRATVAPLEAGVTTTPLLHHSITPGEAAVPGTGLPS